MANGPDGGRFKVKIKDSTTGLYLSGGGSSHQFDPCCWRADDTETPAIVFYYDAGNRRTPNKWSFDGPSGRGGYYLAPDASQTPKRVAGNGTEHPAGWSLESSNGETRLKYEFGDGSADYVIVNDNDNRFATFLRDSGQGQAAANIVIEDVEDDPAESPR
ncbi:MAG: hypothetical protein AB1Z98_05855 [Nannocystaceae bacterium]